jgi:hypothetical protein
VAKLIAIAVLAVLMCGCGSKDETTSQASAPAPAPTAEGIPEGDVDVEEEYHQPPKPASGRIGDTITMTGSNIGVRLRVTVTGVQEAGRHLAVKLGLKNTGIAVFESEMRNAVVRYTDGKRARAARGAGCSWGPDRMVRLDTERRAQGCLLFARPTGAQPKTLQMSLEAIPVSEGGVWRLR